MEKAEASLVFQPNCGEVLIPWLFWLRPWASMGCFNSTPAVGPPPPPPDFRGPRASYQPYEPPAAKPKWECKYGSGCTDTSKEHLDKYRHPEGGVEWYPACKFGHGCFQKNFKHLQCYLHPGDRNYRKGMVRFPKVKGTQMEPEFPTLRVLFNFCDPDASGFLTPEEWPEAWKQLGLLPAQNWESGDRTCAYVYSNFFLL
jgi:hypothetical protein